MQETLTVTGCSHDNWGQFRLQLAATVTISLAAANGPRCHALLPRPSWETSGQPAAAVANWWCAGRFRPQPAAPGRHWPQPTAAVTIGDALSTSLWVNL